MPNRRTFSDRWFGLHVALSTLPDDTAKKVVKEDELLRGYGNDRKAKPRFTRDEGVVLSEYVY
jgi:hypothetical protein